MMMMIMIAVVFLALCGLLQSYHVRHNSLSPFQCRCSLVGARASRASSQCFNPSRGRSSRHAVKVHQVLLFMGSEFERSEPVPKAVKDNAMIETTGTPAVGDDASGPSDEVEEEPEISSSMRERLRQELRSQGADPNYSAGPILGNPILILSAVVLVLVLLGGKDILF